VIQGDAGVKGTGLAASRFRRAIGGITVICDLNGEWLQDMWSAQVQRWLFFTRDGRMASSSPGF
jgi:hypothetical protein